MLRKSIGMSAGLCLMIGGLFALPSLNAQEAGAKVTPPPKVLVLDLEILKPGKAGAPHQKTESLFVNAAKNAKSPNHYLASQALTGPPRALFSYGYDSFAGFEKQFKDETTGSLGAQIDSALQADGDLLESTRRGVFVLHDDMSVNAPCAIGTMRYFQITHVKIHPGKYDTWRDFLKIWKDGEAKTDPDAHIAVYSEAYGAESGGTWLLIHPLRSLDEVDRMNANNEKFRKNVEDWAHYEDLLGSAVESVQRNLYAFDPSMSYVPDDLVNQDPAFWNKK